MDCRDRQNHAYAKPSAMTAHLHDGVQTAHWAADYERKADARSSQGRLSMAVVDQRREGYSEPATLHVNACPTIPSRDPRNDRS